MANLQSRELIAASGRTFNVYTRYNPRSQFPHSAFVSMFEKYGKTQREAVENLAKALGETFTEKTLKQANIY